ncbi:hypothetical protein, partial [Treponema sp. R80B11-R83G3]
MRKKIIIFLFIFISGIAICGIASAVFYRGRYNDLRNTIESANAGAGGGSRGQFFYKERNN